MPWTHHEHRKSLSRKKTAQLLKAINTWIQKAQNVYRMTKEFKAVQKKTNKRLEKADEAATKVDAAATMQKIIGRVKVARGRNQVAIH